MNCKPGDLAIVVSPRDPIYLGKLVEVLYAQPFWLFQLPDGQWHAAANEPGHWVLRLLGDPVWAPVGSSGRRLTNYGCGRDAALKPLPGLPVNEELPEEITA